MTPSEHLLKVREALADLQREFAADIYIKKLRQAVEDAMREYPGAGNTNFTAAMLFTELKGCAKKKDLNNRSKHFDAIGKAVASWSDAFEKGN